MHWKDCWLGLLLTALIFSTVGSIPTALHKRVERVPDDAADWTKVLRWMIEVNVEDEKLVFYSGGRINDAKAFTEANPDYFYFDDIFDEDFQEDFGGANLGNEDVAKACSKAMGWHAKGETRVFGDKDASSDSTWVMTEKPALMSNERVTKIWSMKDSTTDPADHPDGDLKNPGGSEEPESQPPAATKTMQVFWSEVSDGVSPLAWYWQIFVGEAGKGVDPCTGTPINNIYDFSAPSSQNPDVWNEPPTSISGEWKIEVEGMDCTFFGDRLECPGQTITCAADPRPFDDCASLNMPSKAIVHCDW